MSTRIPPLACAVLLVATPLAAQELLCRDGPLPLYNAAAFDEARNRVVVLGDQRDVHEWDGQRWLRRPVLTSDFWRGSLAYHAATRRMVGFGFDSGYAPVTVDWDGVAWRQLSPGTTPPMRSGAAMTYDSNRARVVMFGGFNQVNLGDTWEWDGVNWLQRFPGVSPSPRYATALSFDSARGVTVLFGGQLPQASSDDLWEWDGTNWQQVVLFVRPPPHAYHVMAFDAARSRTVMYSGAGSIWEYDGTSWIQAPVTTPWPTWRSGSALTTDPAGGGVLLTGGFGTSSFARDVWSWNGTAWTARTGLSALPPGIPLRQDSAMATDPASGGVLLFGGGSASFPGTWTNDTWRWDGWNWTQVATSGPSVRFSAQAWTQGNSVYLIGGQTPSSSAWLNDTWRWNGTTWNAVATATSPPAPRYTPVVYDAARGHAVMLSGSSTWTFDGINWQQRNPATSPPLRDHHALAYDPLRSRVVVFGGAGGLTGWWRDTWEWDGSIWTQVNTATPPPGGQSAMAFDARQNRIVLAQITVPLAFLVWTYDGVDWTPLPLLNHYGAGQPPLVAGWPANRGVILFDGAHVVELSPVPAKAERYGSPCGSALALAGRTSPRLGDTDFGLDVVGAPASAPFVLVAATATASLPVGPCTLLVAPGQASLFALANPAGFVSLDMPVPATPTLFGIELFLQVAALEPAAPAGFVMSAGLRVTVGD